MPVTPTYPGLYIEEILSNSHTITAAPTSVTVFVGYTHPFKTKSQHYNEAVQIFSFVDYEREFGGLFSIDWLTDDVGRAVFQFFANGGGVAWVVALRPSLHDLGTGITSELKPPSLLVGTTTSGILFTGREPVDGQTRLTVSTTNLSATTGTTFDIADVTIAYGTRTETYRRVTLGAAAADGDKLEDQIGTVDKPVSSLVTVARPDAGVYPTVWPALLGPTPLDNNLPTAPFTTFVSGDFTAAFQADQPLDKIPIFNLLVIPGVSDSSILSQAIGVAEKKRALLLMDPPSDAVADPTGDPLPMIGDIMSGQVAGRTIPKSQNAALYFPYLLSNDPTTGKPLSIAPSGFVAGVIAREDTNRGVWKAPAGYEALVQNTGGVVPSGRMTDPRQGTLNPIGVNCLRTLPLIGTVVFGARTSVTANAAFQQYWYVPVRRMALFLEQSLLLSLGWVIFEPNDEPLWVSIKTTIDNFMLGLFKQGAFQGNSPSQAFQVTCDSTTTTTDDQANGIVNVVVAFAPLKPAEFVIIKIAQLAGQSQS